MTVIKHMVQDYPDHRLDDGDAVREVRRKEAGDEVHRKVHRLIRETGKGYAAALDDVLTNPDNAGLLRDYAGVSHG